MPFQPSSYQEITIDRVTYRFAEHPNAPGMPYGQEGRQAVVYQLLSETGAKALKVFKTRYSNPSLVSLAEGIEKYAAMPGMEVCQRAVLTPQSNLELLQKFPDLTYAVLMPWIEGSTWQELVLSHQPVTAEQSLALARGLAGILSTLEQKGLAHCDISGANVIVGSTSSPCSTLIALVDVEGLYAPGLLRPEVLPAGSPGYAHRTAPQGLWGTQADRFAGAVLLAEMLGWSDERISQAAWGESYFNPRELQEEGRWHLLQTVLAERWGDAIEHLFNQAWNSAALSECPTFGKWLVALPEEVPVPSSRVAGTADRAEGQGIPAGIQPWLEMGRIFEQQGKFDAALEVYRQAQRQASAGTAQELEGIIDGLQARQGELAQEKISGRDWRCPDCGRLVSGDLQVCPYCEGGQVKEKMHHPPVKRIPWWGWGVLGLAVLGTIIVLLLVSVTLVGLEPLGFLATDTPTATATLTATATPEMTANPVATATTALRIGSTQVSPKDGMLMMYVPAGEFVMGSNLGNPDERPQHTVDLAGYWIDQTEVTNGMYAKCVAAGSCTAPQERTSYTRSSYYGSSQYAGYPVIWVDWEQAKGYCEWAGRRLPSEAEWEKAARGTEGRGYPWEGKRIDCSRANYGESKDKNNCVGDTTEVGSYPTGASPYGVLDMAGNVWEWVADWYDAYPGGDTGAMSDFGQKYRVVRGASWVEYSGIRSAYRVRLDPVRGDNNLGFRCVLSP